MERLLTDEELAKALQRSEVSLRRDRAKGTGIPFVRIGGSVRYRVSDVEKWLAENLQEAC